MTVRELLLKFLKREEPLAYDVTNYAAIEDRGDEDYLWFSVDPPLIYPVTIERIQTILLSGEYPQELIEYDCPPGIDPRSAGQLIVDDARLVSLRGWELALTPKEEVAMPDLPERHFALEVARRYFTQALRCAARRPIGIHIIKNSAFRL